MIVAIDGPAASGKSTVARGVARSLGFKYIDTGAMYRAVTWRALHDHVDVTDEEAVASLARSSSIRVAGPDDGYRIFIDGTEVTEEIRSSRVSAAVSTVSKVPGVRTALVEKQRKLATGVDVVVEGRDIGTVVFPDADVKIYLTASVAERARRRQQELSEKGQSVDVAVIEREIVARDRIDSTRAVSPLACAADAHVIDTTGRAVEEVVGDIVGLVRAP